MVHLRHHDAMRLIAGLLFRDDFFAGVVGAAGLIADQFAALADQL